MLWLIVVILSYFLFAAASLGDKYLLTGPPNPKIYTFFVGTLGISVLLLVPFVGFSVPDFYQIFLCFLAGAFFIFGIFFLYKGLEKFEASRIIPTIGGILPVFTLILVYFFSKGREFLNLFDFLAFLFLISGSVFITVEWGKKISFGGFKISVIAALFFSFFFVLSKYVYLIQPFWVGFIWIRIGVFLVALFFVFTKEVKREIFTTHSVFNKKTGFLFALTQATGAGALILQNWAVALAGLSYIAVINALQGVQYFFLFILTILFAMKNPQILKEKFSKKIILQKFFAVFLIGIGLVILVLE